MKPSKLVSIRIPESMLTELEKQAKEHHFLDLSEQVRTIVRNKYLNSKKGGPDGKA